MLLSIIVVNYASCNLTWKCIKSIERCLDRRNIPSYEIIIVDNFSSQGERAHLKRLFSDNDKVKLLFLKENFGYGTAVNLGVQSATGKYLIISNPDVIFLNDSIPQLLTHMEHSRGCGAAGPKTYLDEDCVFVSSPPYLPKVSRKIFNLLVSQNFFCFKKAKKKLSIRKLRFAESSKPYGVDMLSGGCFIIPRSVYRRVGGFDESYFLFYEDADISKKLNYYGYKMEIVPQAAIIHLWHQVVRNYDQLALWFRSAEEVYFRKYEPGRYKLYKFLQSVVKPKYEEFLQDCALRDFIVQLRRILDKFGKTGDVFLEISTDDLFAPSAFTKLNSKILREKLPSFLQSLPAGSYNMLIIYFPKDSLSKLPKLMQFCKMKCLFS